MKFDFSSDAMKSISKMDANTAGRIIKGIFGLPNKGDVKKLKAYDSTFRLRIGDYRVLFDLEIDVIRIKDVLPRGEAYEK